MRWMRASHVRPRTSHVRPTYVEATVDVFGRFGRGGCQARHDSAWRRSGRGDLRDLARHLDLGCLRKVRPYVSLTTLHNHDKRTRPGRKAPRRRARPGRWAAAPGHRSGSSCAGCAHPTTCRISFAVALRARAAVPRVTGLGAGGAVTPRAPTAPALIDIGRSRIPLGGRECWCGMAAPPSSGHAVQGGLRRACHLHAARQSDMHPPHTREGSRLKEAP